MADMVPGYLYYMMIVKRLVLVLELKQLLFTVDIIIIDRISHQQTSYSNHNTVVSESISHHHDEMRTRQCHSSVSLTRFLVLLNAVLFLAINHQVNFQVIHPIQSSTLGKGLGSSAIAESLSSFHHQGKKKDLSTKDGKDTTAVRSPAIQQKQFSRTLMGIFSSADDSTSALMRSRHRTLIGLWNDTRLCSYTKITKDCQLVYAFIIGAGNASAPTQLVNETGGTSNGKWPLLVEKPIATEFPDLNGDDTALLNIR